MRHASNEKWQTSHNGRSQTTKSRSHQNTWKKGNLQIQGILEADTIKQAEMKEKI